MTIDIPADSPNGNIFEDSTSVSNKEQISSNLTNSETNTIPVIVLKKLEDDNDQYYVQVVSPRSSNRQRKLKNFKDFAMELSPKKRGRPPKSRDDPNMTSPTKKPRTPLKSQRKKDDVEVNVDSLCSPLKNTVKLRTPVKRSLCKSDFSDVELTESALSPRKKGTLESTPIKNTPKREQSKKMDNESPVKIDKSFVCSGRRQCRTPSRYTNTPSPIKSAKKNLNSSFRRSILTSALNQENVRRTTGKTESSTHVGTKRTTRKSYASFYYDSDGGDDDGENKILKKQVEQVVPTNRRILRPRNNSVSLQDSELSSKEEGEDSDIDCVPIQDGNKSIQSKNKPIIVISDDDEPLIEDVQSKTPSRRKQILRPRKDSTTSNASENSEKSPERRPPREVAKTPKTPRNRRTTATSRSVQVTPKTPKNRLKLLRDGVITPSMHSRSSIVPGDSTPLMKARSQLHVSYVPTSLPCREKEYLDVYNFLRGKLEDGYGGCMYISGVPGTGKTATVTSVIVNLQNDKKITKFNYVSVNGMRLTEPRQSYVEIWKQLTGKTIPWEQAQGLLEERFTKKKNMSPVVMLIDELDILCTKRQDVVYNLLDWPTKSKDQLIVITIANTMDLPERLLMSRVTSRLGLTRLTFQAYTHKQLMEIVTKRLTGTNSFNPDAIQLVARKVASVSGDARRALDICRRAAEIAEDEGKDQFVNIMHVNEALNAMITQPQVMAIRRCSRLQKLLLQAIVAEIERTGVEETTFTEVYRILVSCCALDGFKMVSCTVAQRAICELSAYRLIITDQKCSNIYQRIILNVSVHDVYFALKKE